LKIIERLATLKRLNRNPKWVNDDLFRLVCNRDFAVIAYERIKSDAGNMTAGDDGLTLDSMSLAYVERLCNTIRNESYQPTPVRRKNIPKANGKTRPLGIPSPRDKIVQEMIREILESIHDSPETPSFSEASHGFRPSRSCHTAIKEYASWQGTTWLIEGDIKGFFDNIDHHTLIQLLRQRISDERFLNLIWKFLRVGIREENGSLTPSKLGTPQGGTISPILANIYLHEFDLWVEKTQKRLTKGSKRKPNPEWRALIRRKDYLLKTGQAKPDDEEIRELARRAESLPTVLVNDPDFIRIRYVRYADDWIIGVTGPKKMAKRLKEQAAKFLDEKLKLELSKEKTLITNAKDRAANFLSFNLSVGSSVKRRKVKTDGKRTTMKRTTGWQPRVDVPVKEIVQKLQQKGYCHTKGGKEFFPCSKKSLVASTDHDIVMSFNSVWRGIYNYYCVCDNAHKLRWVMYILQYSCLMTLSHKHRRRLPKTISVTGVFPSITYKDASGKEKKVKFWRPQQWQMSKLASHRELDIDQLNALTFKLTHSRLGSPCTVCGSNDKVEMHHLRALRKGNKDITKGFNRILSAINRKQVPLCQKCHNEVHAGRYDGLSLTELAYVPT